MLIQTYRKTIFYLLLPLLAISPTWASGAPGFYQFQISDFANTSSTVFPRTTQTGDLIVGYAGTQLYGSQATGSFTGSPTMSDGTTMTLCSSSGCNFTTSNGILNTQLWTGLSPGGTSPTIAFNTTSPGQTIGGSAFELTGVDTLDQIATGEALNYSGATLTSPNITTTYPNEIILCLAQEANPIAGGNHMSWLNSASSNWTPLAFGNQAMAYLVAPSPGSYSCTINLGSGGAEDYAITLVSFYAASTPPPSACDVNGDGAVNVSDIQSEVNQALGISSCKNDINQDGVCNVNDVQRVVNAAIGGICVTTP